jgi:hypothetical protein
MASFRSVSAAGQLRLATSGAHCREVRHATMTGMIKFAAAGVENSDNAGKGIGPGSEIL